MTSQPLSTSPPSISAPSSPAVIVSAHRSCHRCAGRMIYIMTFMLSAFIVGTLVALLMFGVQSVAVSLLMLRRIT